MPAGPASPASLAAAAGLGALSALWALLLWAELLLSRSGGVPFCTLDATADCTKVWDSTFASAVHKWSGLPVAGWGLAWGLVAGAMPLLALWYLAERRPAPVALLSAIRMVAAAGVVTVVVMLAVSASERVLCLGCFGTYVLVAGYAGMVLFGWQRAGLPEAGRGLAIAASATLLAFLLLLYPGLRTPGPAASAGRAALGAVGGPAGTGDPETDQHLQRFVDSLAPRLQQTLSDSLHIYRTAEARPLAPARRLDGPVSAPVRITEWSDALCGHCAELHVTLDALREHLPAGSFNVDSRQFPLDGACNPMIPSQEGVSVRCLVAKARICLEGHERYPELSRKLFESQELLSPERVFELSAPLRERGALEACLSDPATQAELEEDVALAAPYDPDGTPIVAVNGRRGTSFAPFLYAIVLTRGSSEHPAFAKLPPPNPNAHIH
jgi:protein-disulfide isomerase